MAPARARAVERAARRRARALDAHGGAAHDGGDPRREHARVPTADESTVDRGSERRENRLIAHTVGVGWWRRSRVDAQSAAQIIDAPQREAAVCEVELRQTARQDPTPRRLHVELERDDLRVRAARDGEASARREPSRHCRVFAEAAPRERELRAVGAVCDQRTATALGPPPRCACNRS